MPVISQEIIDSNLAELRTFVSDNIEHLEVMLAYNPKSYSHKSINTMYDEAWRIGFKRCMAELQRIAQSDNVIGDK